MIFKIVSTLPSQKCAANIVLLQEAAYVSSQFFYETVRSHLFLRGNPVDAVKARFNLISRILHALQVAPLLCIGNTSFIAISTLTTGRKCICICFRARHTHPEKLCTELNFYSKLISKVDPLTNTAMFRAIQIQLACSACIAAEKAHLCQHMSHLIPRWQDSEKHRKLKTIMSDRAVIYVAFIACAFVFMMHHSRCAHDYRTSSTVNFRVLRLETMINAFVSWI